MMLQYQGKLHKHQSEEKDDDIVFSLLVFGHIENTAWFMTQPENDIWLPSLEIPLFPKY